MAQSNDLLDIARPYRNPLDAFNNRKLPAGYAGAGRGALGGATSMDLDTAPGTPSDIARKSAYTMNRPKGSIFDAPNPLSITGQLAGELDQQVIAGAQYQPPATPTPPPVAQPNPNAVRADIAAPVPNNIMPPQPPGNVPLVPTDSTAAPQNIAAAPVAPAPTLDTSTQLALSAARSDAAGRVDPGTQGGGMTGFADSATAARNAGMDANRTRYLAEQALNHGGVRGASQYAAIENAGASAAGERNVALQTQAQTQTALARTGADLNIARMGDATHRYATDQTGLLTARGQDIGAATHAAGAKNALDIAGLHGATAEKVANITSDGRVDSAVTRAGTVRYSPVQLPDTLAPDGISVLKGGHGLLNNQTGEITYPTVPKPLVSPKPDAVALLKRDPSLASKFDEVYGDGAAKRALAN